MIQIFRLITLLFFLISVCCPQTKSRQKLVIGYELYSWRDTRGDWVFSLLPNTSSEKTVEVIFDENRALHGVEQLERELTKLAQGEHIFWLDRIPSGTGTRAEGSKGLCYPPAKMIKEIKIYSKSHGITVEVLPSEEKTGKRGQPELH